MSYSIDPITVGCYENTCCLVNKYDIRDENKLAEVEAQITLAKYTALLSAAVPKCLDFNYYKYIHKYLFEDLYDWAGKVRTFDISKNGTVFCSAENLENVCQRAFERLETEIAL